MSENVTFGNWNHISNLKDYPRKDVNCYHLLVCPVCGACHRAKLCDTGELINANYCPNCGKDMRRKND
jgi:hypothetical protein